MDEYRRLKLQRDLQKAAAAQERWAKKAADVKKRMRASKARLKASTRSSTWHAHRIADVELKAGADGETSAARHYLRTRSWEDYVRLVGSHAEAMPDAPVAAIEAAAVKANAELWGKQGEALILEDASRRYWAEVAGWQTWQAAHPDKRDWRSKPQSRGQAMLVMRTAELLGIDAPLGMNRGDAHDWLADHGGNQRLRSGDGDAPEQGALL